jgi:hypothetical protein
MWYDTGTYVRVTAVLLYIQSFSLQTRQKSKMDVCKGILNLVTGYIVPQAILTLPVIMLFSLLEMSVGNE